VCVAQRMEDIREIPKEEKVMQRFLLSLFGGRLRTLLIISFSLIASITVGVGAVATSRTITEYLASAADERVARDMDLARAFYDIRMERVARVSQRLALSLPLKNMLIALAQGNARAVFTIEQEIHNEIEVPTISGNQLVLVLNARGDVLVGQLLSTDGSLTSVPPGGDWGTLPIVTRALSSKSAVFATEVVPVEFLAPMGLDDQARVDLVDTPMAAPEPYDPREGTASLALVSVAPVLESSATASRPMASGKVLGAVVCMHLFNNDFTLVDRIKEVAGVDTATIFFGDLRVSTNVLDEHGSRAIGTRISQEVRDVVLVQGLTYPGRAYVVKEWFITRYEPLYDHLGNVVGSLYVGAREASFQALVQTFVARVIYIALATIGSAALLALPVSIAITRPITDLVDAHSRLAGGEMDVRVTSAQGRGELATLTRSFNTMAANLQATQEQLVQKEKLASVGQLAAGVAHEINNPLGSILLLADVLYKEAPEGDTRRQDLKMITEQARRCKGIVFGLLSFARENRVMAQETDINRLVESVVAEQTAADAGAPAGRYRNVRIVRKLDPHSPVIQADPDQIRQCLINLMSNAVGAMEPDGGTLTISTRAPSSLPSGPTGYVEIDVSDTGSGMSEEILSNLFTPFFTTKPPGKGTGLGLSIIYGIVKMHRGDIRVQSELGKGTTFTIVLPTRLPEATGARRM
jgi:two-component system NtrC family sensor kinase